MELFLGTTRCITAGDFLNLMTIGIRGPDLHRCGCRFVLQQGLERRQPARGHFPPGRHDVPVPAGDLLFVHFGEGHAQQVWSQELAFHHAAIPLALLVLLQDYRFVLLDAFLRFLANVLLAGLFVSGGAAVWRLDPLRGTPAPFDQALLLIGACMLLIVFALLRARVQAALTRLVFHRKDVEALLRNLKQVVREEQSYVESAAAQLGEFVQRTSEPQSRHRPGGPGVA